VDGRSHPGGRRGPGRESSLATLEGRRDHRAVRPVKWILAEPERKFEGPSPRRAEPARRRPGNAETWFAP